MARELSQAELLDFLCQAGGRASNAALLAHFKGFLRDPDASPAEVRRRRELFKGCVNSVATVKPEGPDGAKYVVLRKRYRDLVGDVEPKPHDAAAGRAPESPPPRAPLDVPGSRAQQPPPPPKQQQRGQPGAPGGRAQRLCSRPAEEEAPPGRRSCPGSPHGLRARPGPRREPPPSSPPRGGAPLDGEARSRQNGRDGPRRGPPALRGEAPPSPGPPSPIWAMGAAPSDGSLRRRVGEWVAQAREGASRLPESPPRPCPSPPLDSRPGPEDWRVFRSIRCQLSLQDWDDFVEQESPGSEDSGGEGEPGALLRPPAPAEQNGWLPTPLAVTHRKAEGLSGKPLTNGAVEPCAKTIGSPQGAAIPGRLGQIVRGSPWEEELSHSKKPNGYLPKPRVVPRLPSPNPDAPLSPQLAPQRGHPSSTVAVEGPGPETDGSPEHRSSLVPLEPREHAWLVKVAAGLWLQARALFLEDPHLVVRKDFISGYTVLHWLAKHGNTQVLLDFATGARKAGVALDVNVKSGCGYTPLHLAAMHGHQAVIRLLVQKLQCQVQVRDGSGKRPWQYLSSSTSGEIWQLLGAPKGKTIFPARPIARSASSARRGKSPDLARKISRKTSLAAYLKPQHIRWKMTNRYPALQETEEYSD